MAIETELVTKKIVKLLVKWEQDIDTDIYDYLDCQAVMFKKHEVNVHQTYLNLITEEGCTPEQSRQQIANFIATVDSWKNNSWHYLGCIVCAVEEGIDENKQEIAFNSVWGIESFSGKDYALEIEHDLRLQVKQELETLGYSFTNEEFAELPIEFAEDSYPPLDQNPAKYTRALQLLPEDTEQFTFRYASSEDVYDNGEDAEEGEILAQCTDCDYTMPLDEKDNAKYHADMYSYVCPRFETEEE